MVLYLFHIIAIFSFEKVNILKILNNYVESIYFMDINCKLQPNDLPHTVFWNL